MNIGEAARASGLPARTLRYYEAIGLVVPGGRRENGYRDYHQLDVHRLRFVQRARSLGFSVEDCRELLALYEDRSRTSAEVKGIALARIAAIERKICELEAMRRALLHLAEKCHGDERSDCPILDDLAGATPRGDGSGGTGPDEDHAGADEADGGADQVPAVRHRPLDEPQPAE